MACKHRRMSKITCYAAYEAKIGPEHQLLTYLKRLEGSVTHPALLGRRPREAPQLTEDVTQPRTRWGPSSRSSPWISWALWRVQAPACKAGCKARFSTLKEPRHSAARASHLPEWEMRGPRHVEILKGGSPQASAEDMG